MHNYLLLPAWIVIAATIAAAQGIRKDFREMSEAEKIAYRQAIRNFASGSQQDLVIALANWHNQNAPHIHTHPNHPSPESQNQFLSWHRMVLWEMESAIQNEDPRLSVPYWDWRAVRDTTDSLFQVFLHKDSLPSTWNLIRQLGQSSTLPTSSQVTCVQGKTSFWSWSGGTCGLNYYVGYTNSLEWDIHGRPHVWVGGTMSQMVSPRDPLFYLHHSMVDKLWQEWQEDQSASSFSLKSLNRYDGNESNQYVGTLPDIHVDSILDSRRMVFEDHRIGVFYSRDGVARLNGGYEVDNAYLPTEFFVYQNDIIASEFTVPQSKSAVIHSGSRIILNSGFVAKGTLVLKVGDYDNEGFPLAKPAAQEAVVEKQPEFPLPPGIIRVSLSTADRLQVVFRISESLPVAVDAFSSDGRRLSTMSSARHFEAGEHTLLVSIRYGYRGVVYLRLRTGNQLYTKAASLL